MFCPAGVSWSPGGETGPMAQRVRKIQLLAALRNFDEPESFGVGEEAFEKSQYIIFKHRFNFTPNF